MTILEWSSEEKKRIDRFVDSWREGNTQNPEHFPNEMPEGEWDEQYRGYDE